MVTKRKRTDPVRPPKPERDGIRRREIVEAARRCVLRQGFHASPVAQIAREAGMSVGQVYRYFDGKDAIIRAIVEDIIATRVHNMTHSPESPFTAERLATRTTYFDERHREDSLLMLEVTAEASRNAEIAAVVRDADRRSQEEAIRKTLERNPGLDPAEAAARCEVAAVLIEGTHFRQATALHADPERVRALYDRVLEALALPDVPAS